ncbi:MAG: motility protein A [Clostridia bacterium]|nr:motility protein A [Clostridia bacterium]
MTISTIIGLVAGFACIIVGILINGKIPDFIDPASIFIVIGGTLCSIVISYPISLIVDTVKSVKLCFSKNAFDPNDNIEQIIELANTARKNGLLALEDMLESIENPFLRKGIMLIVDGSNSELVKSVMETEAYFIQERHNRCIAVLNTGSSCAPAFGMVGTLIGLINMLVNLSDSASLGPSMSVALVTTFYGVVLANYIFSPFAKKLGVYTAYEELQNEMMIEGILAIQDGEHPRMIRDKLESFISSREKAVLAERLDRKKDNGEEK